MIRPKDESAHRSRSGLWEPVEGIDATVSRFFAAAPAGVALLDNQQRVLKINDALASLFGKRASDLLGNTIAEMLPEVELDELSRRVLETGEPENNLRLQLPSCSGSLHSLDTSLFPICGANDEACAVGVIVVDVTDRERVAEHLREREAQFHALADNIPQLAWMADEHGSIFWYNQRWYDYTGGTLAESRDRGWVRYHHPEAVDQVVARIEHSFRAGEIWEDTFRLRGVDGEYRWFLSRATPIRDDNGQVRWFGTNTDITEQRLLDQATAHLSESIEPETTFPKIARLAIPTLADVCFFDLLEGDKLRRIAWAHVDPACEAAWASRVLHLVPDLSAVQHPVVRALVGGETILESDLTSGCFDEKRALTHEQRSFYDRRLQLADRRAPESGRPDPGCTEPRLLRNAATIPHDRAEATRRGARTTGCARHRQRATLRSCTQRGPCRRAGARDGLA